MFVQDAFRMGRVLIALRRSGEKCDLREGDKRRFIAAT